MSIFRKRIADTTYGDVANALLAVTVVLLLRAPLAALDDSVRRSRMTWGSVALSFVLTCGLFFGCFWVWLRF